MDQTYRLAYLCISLYLAIAPLIPTGITAQNRSAYFEGGRSASIITVPFHSSFNSYQKTRALTYEAWVKPVRPVADAAIISKAIGNCNDNWFLGVNDTTTILFGTGNSCTGDEVSLRAPGALQFGVWQHVAGVWDGSTVVIYHNGRRIAWRKYAGMPVADSVGISIGATNHWDGNFNSFGGYIDEVRVSNRAMYKDDFTPPHYLRAEPSSLILFHFDRAESGPAVHSANAEIAGWMKNVRFVSGNADITEFQYRPTSRTFALFHFDETSGPTGRNEANPAMPIQLLNAEVSGGRFNRARYFSSLGSYGVFNVLRSARDSLEESFTIEAWMLVEKLPRVGEAAITEWPGVWKVALQHDGKVTITVSREEITSKLVTQNAAPFGKWFHLACAWRGISETQNIQVNSILTAGTISSLSSVGPGGPNVFVGMPGSSGAAFVIDEFCVSNYAKSSNDFNLLVPPGVIEAEHSDAGVRLRWYYTKSAVPLKEFVIYRGHTLAALSRIGSTAMREFVDTTVKTGTEYYYKITSVDSSGFESPAVRIVTYRTSGLSGKHITLISSIVILIVFVAGYSILNYRRTRKGAGIKFPAYMGNGEARDRPGIFVFGEFRLLNKAGEDVALKMRPLQRQLFVLLYVYRNRGGTEGISVERLTSQFWRDLDPESAKNSRGVALNRLRSYLTELPGITVTTEKKRWVLVVSPEYYSEFDEFKSLHSSLEKTAVDSGVLDKYTKILRRGPLLKMWGHEWLDALQSEVHIDVIRTLTRLAALVPNQEEKLKIGRALLEWDSVNETGVRLVIQALSEQGRHGEAKAEFERFCKCYIDIVGKPYLKSYDFLATTDKKSS